MPIWSLNMCRYWLQRRITKETRWIIELSSLLQWNCSSNRLMAPFEMRGAQASANRRYWIIRRDRLFYQSADCRQCFHCFRLGTPFQLFFYIDFLVISKSFRSINSQNAWTPNICTTNHDELKKTARTKIKENNSISSHKIARKTMNVPYDILNYSCSAWGGNKLTNPLT